MHPPCHDAVARHGPGQDLDHPHQRGASHRYGLFDRGGDRGPHSRDPACLAPRGTQVDPHQAPDVLATHGHQGPAHPGSPAAGEHLLGELREPRLARGDAGHLLHLQEPPAPVQRVGLGRDQQVQELEHSASQGHQEDPASLRLDHRTYGHPGLQWVQGSARAVPRGGQGSAPGDQQNGVSAAVLSQGGSAPRGAVRRGRGRDQAVDRGHYLGDERRRLQPST